MSSYDLWAKNGVHMQNCPVLCKEWWIPFGDFLKISWMLRKNKIIFVKTSKISEKALSHNTLQKTQKNQQSYKNYTEHRQMIAMVFFVVSENLCYSDINKINSASVARAIHFSASAEESIGSKNGTQMAGFERMMGKELKVA